MPATTSTGFGYSIRVSSVTRIVVFFPTPINKKTVSIPSLSTLENGNTCRFLTSAVKLYPLTGYTVESSLESLVSQPLVEMTRY
jgi:hypothetical protein